MKRAARRLLLSLGILTTACIFGPEPVDISFSGPDEVTGDTGSYESFMLCNYRTTVTASGGTGKWESWQLGSTEQDLTDLVDQWGSDVIKGGESAEIRWFGVAEKGSQQWGTLTLRFEDGTGTLRSKSRDVLCVSP